MKIKNLILYYPSFESGGVERIIKILIQYLSKTKIKVFFITSSNKKVNFLKKYNNNIEIIYPQKKYFNFLPSRLYTSINCTYRVTSMRRTTQKIAFQLRI